MDQDLKAWGIGLFVAVIVGGVVTGTSLFWLRKWLGLNTKPRSEKSIPNWLTGAVERLVFMILVAVNLGAAPAMLGWLALKLATNWNNKDREADPDRRAFAFSALLAGLLSMLFAGVGGLIAKGELWGRLVSCL